MELKKFKRLLDKKYIIITNEAIQSKDIIEEYKKVDFKCGIHGCPISCKKTIIPTLENRYKIKGMLCCSRCNETVGYLKYINDKSIKQIAKKFNYKTGFWRKDKGCTLPISQRSKVCITYYCGVNEEASRFFKKAQNREYDLGEKYE